MSRDVDTFPIPTFPLFTVTLTGLATESCDDVAKGLVKAVGKLQSGFSVGKRVGQVNGKSGWWFIVRVPDSCLLEVDKKWNHKYWQWQLVQGNESAFLGVGPASARHR